MKNITTYIRCVRANWFTATASMISITGIVIMLSGLLTSAGIVLAFGSLTSLTGVLIFILTNFGLSTWTAYLATTRCLEQHGEVDRRIFEHFDHYCGRQGMYLAINDELRRKGRIVTF